MKTNYLTLIVFLYLIIFANSCCSQRLVTAESRVRDSVVIELREREVVINDTVILEIAPQSEQVTLRSDSSRLENQYAISEAIILSGGELYHTLETREQSITQPTISRVNLRDSIIYHHRELSQTQIQHIERPLSRWQRFQILGFWVLALAFMMVIALKF